MSKIIIFLLKETIKIFIYENNHYNIFYINGEEAVEFYIENLEEICESLKYELIDTMNIDNLDNIDIDVIYHQDNTEVIKMLNKKLLPCKTFQVLSVEKILPEVLLKLEIIKPNKEVVVRFDGENYSLNMNTEGFGSIELIIDDILKGLLNNFTFIDNKESINKLEESIDVFYNSMRKYIDNNVKENELDLVNNRRVDNESSLELLKNEMIIALNVMIERGKIIESQNQEIINLNNQIINERVNTNNKVNAIKKEVISRREIIGYNKSLNNTEHRPWVVR